MVTFKLRRLFNKLTQPGRRRKSGILLFLSQVRRATKWSQRIRKLKVWHRTIKIYQLKFFEQIMGIHIDKILYKDIFIKIVNFPFHFILFHLFQNQIFHLFSPWLLFQRR